MLFAGENLAVNSLLSLDSDLLVDNYMNKSIIPGYNDIEDTTILDDLSIAVQAGLYGMANNAINIGNYFGADLDTFDVAEELGDLGDAYTASKGSYDLFGDVITSFIPGTIAFKALNAMKLAKTGGVISRTLGFFDNKAKAALQESAGIYRNALNVTEVKALKRKAFGYSLLDEAVSGAVIGASIEVSQHLGEIMVDESLDFTDKLAKFASPVVLGATIGTPFGAFGYFDKARKIIKPVTDARKEAFADMAYGSLITKDSEIVGKEHASNHMLDEIDRITDYTPNKEFDQPVVDLARAEFIDQAKGQYKRYITEIATGSSTLGKGTAEQKEVVKELRSIFDENIDSKEGREVLRNLMDKVTDADTSARHIYDRGYAVTKDRKYRDIGLSIESPSNADDLFHPVTDFQGSDFVMVPLNETVKKKAGKVDTLQKPLSVMALNADHPEVMNNLDKYKLLNRSIGATDNSIKELAREDSVVKMLTQLDDFMSVNAIETPEHVGLFPKLAKVKEILDSGESFHTPSGVTDKVFKKSMTDLFKKLDEDKITDYLLTDQANKWMRLDTGIVSNKPIATLYGKNLTAIKTPNKVTKNTSLLGIQKLRLQANKYVNSVNKKYFEDNLLSKKNAKLNDSVSAWTRLEALVVRATKEGSASVGLGKKSKIGEYAESFTYEEAYKLIRKGKRDAAVELLKRHSGDDVLHTLGVTDMGALMSEARLPLRASGKFIDELIVNPKSLTDLKQIRLTLKTKTLDPAETLLRGVDDTGRIDQIIQLKTVASQVVGQELDQFMPKIPSLGYYEEIGAERLFFDSHLLGDIGSLNAVTAHIGDQVLAMKDRLVGKTKTKYHIDSLHNSLINNPQAAGEVSAFIYWYRQQGQKFALMKNAQGKGIAVDIETVKKYREYENSLKGSEYVADNIETWIGKTNGLKPNTYTIGDDTAMDYISSLQRMNSEDILKPKRLIDEAYHNTVNDDQGYIYIPPPNLPFIRYFRVNSNNPLDQTSSTLYRVGSKSKQGLSAKIDEAEKYFSEKGIKAQLISGDDAATQASLKLEFNWDGLDQNLGRANSSVKRSGANPDTTLSTINEIIAETNDWIENSLSGISRAATEMHYADEISKMRSLKSQAEKRRFIGDDTLEGAEETRRNISTFDTLHRQMLGKDAPFSLYNKANNFLAESVATLMQPAHTARLIIRDAISESGKITRKEISKVDKIAKQALKDRGLEDPFGDSLTAYLKEETTLTGKDIQEAVGGLQYIATTLMLRIDGIDPIMNVLGMTTKLGSEMKYIQQAIDGNPTLTGRVNDVYAKWFGAGTFQEANSGVDLNMMSPFKAVAVGMNDMFNGEARVFLDELAELGIYKNDVRIYSELIEGLPIDTNISDAVSKARFLGKTRDNVKKATLWLTTPHKVSTDLTQYTALKFASELADAAGVDLATKRMLMNGMNHRVNAISSHVSKPRLFQGLAGNAVSLYQNYFMHTIANMTRHAKTTGSGPVLRNIMLNSSFFGMQSTPAFNWINEQVASQQDNDNIDLYSTAYQVLPEGLADAVMYGVGSTLLRGDLTSRGNMTPRYATVFPTSIEQIPIVSTLQNTIGSIISNTVKLATGEQEVTQTMMNTIIDSKLNRPMTGIMRMISGYTADSRNSLVSTHDDVYNWSSAIRALGAKPLDEARINRAYWNLQSYRTRDQQRQTNLGSIMKGEVLNNPDVMEDPEWINNKYRSYINAGGNGKNFKRFYEQNILKANTTFEQRLHRSIRNLDTAMNYKGVLGIE